MPCCVCAMNGALSGSERTDPVARPSASPASGQAPLRAGGTCRSHCLQSLCCVSLNSKHNSPSGCLRAPFYQRVWTGEALSRTRAGGRYRAPTRECLMLNPGEPALAAWVTGADGRANLHLSEEASLCRWLLPLHRDVREPKGPWWQRRVRTRPAGCDSQRTDRLFAGAPHAGGMTSPSTMEQDVSAGRDVLSVPVAPDGGAGVPTWDARRLGSAHCCFCLR